MHIYLRPQLLSLPFSLLLCSLPLTFLNHKGILRSPRLRRITEIGLLNLFRSDDHDSEILPRNGIMQILHLLSELMLLIRLFPMRRRSWRWIFPAPCIT